MSVRFPVPPAGRVSSLYEAVPELVEDRPQRLKVSVYRLGEDGERNLVTVYERRNVYMDETFEPFRQLKDGVWKDYALISSSMNRLEVLDLSSGEVVAVEPHPVFTQEMLDEMSETARTHNQHKVGDSMPERNLRVYSFYVPDWWSHFYESDVEWKDTKSGEHQYELEEFMDASGQWGLCSVYTGWREEDYPTLRYIDLSRISEGVVTSDARFGEIEVWDNLKSVEFYPGDDTIIVPTRVTARISQGAVMKPKANFVDHWND